MDTTWIVVADRLRDQIDAATAACITREIDKNLTRCPVEDIRELLAQ